MKYEYTEDESASSMEKAKAYLFDVVILLLLGVIALMGVITIHQNLPSFKKQVNKVETQIKVMNEMTEEAKLCELDKNGKPISLNDMYTKYAISHILLSYDNNEAYFNEKGISNLHEHENVKDKYSSITVETDCLANLYVNYFPNLKGEFNQPDYGGVSPILYFKNVLISENENLELFDMEQDYPVLKRDYAFRLCEYIIFEKRMDNLQAQRNNDLFADIFQKTFKHNSELFQELTFYQTEYAKYEEGYKELSIGIVIDILISYLITALILFVLIPLLFKDGGTLGQHFANLRVFSLTSDKMRVCQKLLRALLNIVIYFPSIFLVAFLITGTNALLNTLFMIGSFAVDMMDIIYVIGALGIANALVSYIKKDKRSIVDISSQSFVAHKDFIKKVEAQSE